MKTRFLLILLILSVIGVTNAQSDSCAEYSNMRRVKFRLAADMPNGMDNAVKILDKEELQLLLSDRQFKTYNHARSCYIASIPLLSFSAYLTICGSVILGIGLVQNDSGADLLGVISYFAFGEALLFLIPGTTLIIYSAKKLNKIANDFNSLHYQSNLQIRCGFVGNGIGIRLCF